MDTKVKSKENDLSESCASLCGDLPQNVGENERMVSMFGGGVLATAGLLRGSPVFLTLGLGLAFRGLTGYCPIYQAMENRPERLNDRRTKIAF
jgi:uncharacterized membrane protein